MPDQKDAALAIDNHRLGAQRQGAGKSRKDAQQTLNE
jgi:hypothetical protein